MARPRPQLEFKHDAGEPPQAPRPDTMLTLPGTRIPALKPCFCQEFQIHLSLKHICNSFIHNQAVGLGSWIPSVWRSVADSSMSCSEYWLLWSRRELSDQPHRSSGPSRNTRGRPKQSAQQNLLCSHQIQINTGQHRSTSKISAQTDKYMKSRQLLTMLHGKTQNHTFAATKESLNCCDHTFKWEWCRERAISPDRIYIYVCSCREEASPFQAWAQGPICAHWQRWGIRASVLT